MSSVNWLGSSTTSNTIWIDDSTYTTDQPIVDYGSSTAVPYQQAYWGGDSDYIQTTDNGACGPWALHTTPLKPFPKLEMWPEGLRSEK